MFLLPLSINNDRMPTITNLAIDEKGGLKRDCRWSFLAMM